MATSDAIKQQVRLASDIVDVIGRYVRLSKAGRNFRGLCPFHNEKTPSFNVHPEKQIFRCFGCGAGGDVFSFIQKRENLTFPETLRLLADRANIDISTSERQGPKTGPDRADLYRTNEWAARWFRKQFESPAGAAAREYALGRGLTAETIATYELGFAPESWDAMLIAARERNIPVSDLVLLGLTKERDQGSGHYDAYRNRLMFPIRDTMNRVVGFGGRTLGDDRAKYINSSQSIIFDKSRLVYGLEHGREAIQKSGRVIVVEGYLDCLMAKQCGFGEAVATLGTALTESHIALLRRYSDAVFVMFDSDEAGQKAAERSLPLFLSQQVLVRLAAVPSGKDPCDFLQTSGSEAFEAILNSAVGALEFKWAQLERQYRAGEFGPDRIRAIDDFIGLLAGAFDVGAMDSIQRGLAVNQIAQLLKIDAADVHRRLRDETERRRKAPRRDTEEQAGRTPVRLVPPTDPIGAATQTLLGVLLDEPGYYSQVAADFRPETLPQPQRGVAEHLVRLAREWGEFSLAELLGGMEDPDLVNAAVLLHSAAEEMGNHELNVRSAVERIRSEREQIGIAALADVIRRPDEADSESDDKVRALGAAARKRSHFLPPRTAPATINPARDRNAGATFKSN